MGVLGEGPEAELVDPEAVPSLSVRQRFVLPLVRADVKRVLEPAPYPPVVEPMLAIPGLPVPPPAPVELAGPPPVVQPAQKSYPAPRIALYPNGYHLLMRDKQRQVVWDDVLAFIDGRRN